MPVLPPPPLTTTTKQDKDKANKKAKARHPAAAALRAMGVGAAATACLLALAPLPAAAEQIGSVDTAFKLIGPDHKVVVEAYDDPKVAGVTCYVSRAKTGGIGGALGLAEDKAEAAIACRQVGPIQISQPLPQQEEMFNERLSLVFKRLRVVRLVDTKRHTLVYLTYSDRLVDGSPKNSVTAVPVDRGVELKIR